MKITFTDELMPENFQEAARMLKRPYLKISEARAKRLKTSSQGRGDILICDGKRMTFGAADGGVGFNASC